MKLHGSCQCEKVRFTVESETPYPYQFCFCSICRKTCGAGFGCNIMGRRESLRVRGERYLKRYHAVVRKRGQRARRSGAFRAFCGECGTHLWLEDSSYPDGVWPNAAAIDDALPVPPSRVYLMTRYKPKWVPWPSARANKFAEYPKLSIADWHTRHGLHGG